MSIGVVAPRPIHRRPRTSRYASAVPSKVAGIDLKALCQHPGDDVDQDVSAEGHTVIVSKTFLFETLSWSPAET